MSPREIVTSRANPAVKRLRALLAGGSRGPLAVLEGVKLAAEALAAGVDVVEVAVSPDALEGPHAALVTRLEEKGAAIRILAPAVLAGLSEAETSQGMLAIARRPVFDEARILHGTPLVLVAVGVQNPGNLGALLRTAEAAGATGAYLTAGCADPMSWKALRGAMGSAFRLPHVAGLEAGDALDRLQRAGVAEVATDPDAPDLYDAVDLTGPVALLFGNEGAGLPAEVAARARLRVRIPMAPPVESLNVGVAAGVLFFEAARQRRGGSRVIR
jgi:TrmH family RNA methyltransferase